MKCKGLNYGAIVKQMFVNFDDLLKIRKENADKSIIFAGGVFDLLHPGHLNLFKMMKKEADIVIVAVSSDSRVKQRKGPTRPIYNEITRAEIVSSLRDVDYCLIAPEPSGSEVPTVQIFRSLRPNHFMTSDKSWLKYKDIFDELNIKLHLVPRFCYEISTTQTIDKIKQLDKDSRLRKIFLKDYHPIKVAKWTSKYIINNTFDRSDRNRSKTL